MVEFIVKIFALTLSVFLSGAIGMWFTGTIFPELSYWNYVGISVFLTWVVSAGCNLALIENK